VHVQLDDPLGWLAWRGLTTDEAERETEEENAMHGDSESWKPAIVSTPGTTNQPYRSNQEATRMPAFTLPGHRVGLRPIRLDDVDDILTWVNDPAVTRNFADLSKTITREQELAFLQRTLDSDTERLFAIVDQQGAYLGNAGLHKIYWPARNGRLGIVLGMPGSRGRGLGVEVLSLLVQLGFSELGLHKLWLIHFASNDRMRHIAGKLGFQEEGVLRDEYFHADGFHDMVRHGLLATDPRPSLNLAAQSSC
jgi:RimJ/RimL family protein N-acetyltransferase